MEYIPSDTSISTYRNQLARSLQTFQHKSWRRYDQSRIENVYLRCRPVRCSSAQWSTSCKATEHSQQQSQNMCTKSFMGKYTAYDHLSHTMVHDLATGDPLELINGHNVLKTRSANSSQSGWVNSAEPDLPGTISKMQELRPEKLDDVYMPSDKQDRKKYDFDANNVHIPEYVFSDPLSLDSKTFDFQNKKQMKKGCEKEEEKRKHSILDRLEEIGRIQIESHESEEKKDKSEELQIEKVSVTRWLKLKSADRKCCQDCVQQACVGNCPEKRNKLDLCQLGRQTCCKHVCNRGMYENFARTKSKYEYSQNKKGKCKFCAVCQSKNKASLINANNVILGRPRSAYVTYEHGQKSTYPQTLRPNSAAAIKSPMFEEFNQLNIHSRPYFSKKKKQNPQGRASLCPGKSYFSQRRCSLTDHSIARRPQSARITQQLIRPKSARKKNRPRTAH